jgi:quercetin dioxygenase-like cupin family protein
MISKFLIASLLGTGLAVSVLASSGSGGGVETVVVLQRSASWNEVPYKSYPSGTPELTLKRMTIPPRTALPWHTHPVPNVAYIVSGHLTVEDRATGKSAIYRAGEAFAESVDQVHRGRTDDEAAVVLVTYAGAPGVTLSQPIPAGE